MGMHCWIRRGELKQREGGRVAETRLAKRERERRKLQVAEQMGQQHAALCTAAHDGAEHRCRCQEGGGGGKGTESRSVHATRKRTSPLLCAKGERAVCAPKGRELCSVLATQGSGHLPPLLCAAEA